MPEDLPIVRLTRDLTAALHHPGEIARMARRGEIERLRRGAFSEDVTDDLLLRHRLLIRGTVPQISSDAVLSHVSAAVLHGLPVLSPRLGQVHWTRSRVSGGRSRPQVHVYATPIAPHEVVGVDGLAVTSLERTVVDLARHLPFAEGVMVADAALHAGLDRTLLHESLGAARRRPGANRARRVVDFADGRSESPGESWSRVEFSAAGRPPTHLQYEVADAHGVVLGRSDFCWEEAGVLGEFDGMVKYDALLRPGETTFDVVMREKRREERLREQGWEIIRWIWKEIGVPGLLSRRLDQAARLVARRRSQPRG